MREDNAVIVNRLQEEIGSAATAKAKQRAYRRLADFCVSRMECDRALYPIALDCMQREIELRLEANKGRTDGATVDRVCALAETVLANYRPSMAESLLHKALSHGPLFTHPYGVAECNRLLAQTQLRMENWPTAVVHAQNAIAKYRQIALFRPRVVKRMGDAYLMLAEAYMELGDARKAHDCDDKAVRIYVNTDRRNMRHGKQNLPERTMEMFLCAKLVWRETHDFYDAESYVRGGYYLACGLDEPEETATRIRLDARYHYETARLALAAEQYEVAENFARTAANELAEHLEECPYLHAALGDCLQTVGHAIGAKGLHARALRAYSAALTHYAEVLRDNPDAELPAEANCHRHMGDMYAKMGQTDQAEESYLEALRLRKQLPQSPAKYYEWAVDCLRLAELYRETGDHCKALEYYRHAMKYAKNCGERHRRLMDTVSSLLPSLTES